jgi:GNAT superfamily N-acetyltransferase
MILRPATPADAASVADIWLQGWRDGHLGNVPASLVAIRTPATFASRALTQVPFTTVAVVSDSVAGFVMVHDDEVEQVYVSAEHRGSGVAAALLAEAERLVALAGYARAWLAVAAGNARARRFYERSGWVDEGAFDYPAPDSDLAVPCHRYARSLA